MTSSGGLAGGPITANFDCQELLQGQTLSVLGLTLTVTADMTADEVAAAFRGIATNSQSGQHTAKGTWSGQFTGIDTHSGTSGKLMIVQNAGASDIVPIVTGATENTVVTFGAMTADQIISVGGLVLTAQGYMTAPEVAAAFANLAVGSVGVPVTHGTWEGALSGFTSASVTDSATVTFTSSTLNKDVTDLPVISGRTETATVTFTALATGESVTVGGLTLTVNTDTDASEVASAFNNLSAGATEGSMWAHVDGTWSGQLTGFTSESDDPLGGGFGGGGPNHSPTVTFTSTTPQQNVEDLSVSGASRTETANVQFKDLAAGDTITVAGLTLTATAAVAAADVAAGFAGLVAGATAGNTITGATWSGELAAFATAGVSAVGSKLVFTSSTADTDVPNIAISSTSSGGAVRPTAVITQGEGGASDSYALQADDSNMDTITGFDTAHDKLALPSGAGVVADGAGSWGSTGINDLTISGTSNDIVSFGGSAAAGASAWEMVSAVLTAAGSQTFTTAVVHGSDTYVIQTDGIAGAQTSDLVVKLADIQVNNLAFVQAPAAPDTTAPTITSVAVPANATYKVGDKLTFTLNTDEVVTVNTTNGTPQLALTIGSTDVEASYVSGSGSKALVFSYTVEAGQADTDGIAVGTLGSKNGTLKDAAGNNLVLTLPNMNPTTGILVDGVAPTLASSTPADEAGAVAVGANLVLTFSENVKVGTGNIVIKKVSDNSVVATIAVGDAQVSIDDKLVTINPTADLEESTAYYVEIAATAFTDMAGNAYAGINNTTALNFTTAAASLAITQDTTNITAAFAGYSGTNATVDATGMSAAQLNAVATAIAKVKADGITGTFDVDSDVAAADITSLLGKTAGTAMVSVTTDDMNGEALTAVGSAMAKVDTLDLYDNHVVATDAAQVTGKTLAIGGTDAYPGRLDINGTADAETINLSGISIKDANVMVTGLGGADTITLGTGSFVLNYTDADDGGAGGDVVTGYNAATDSIRISGGLAAALKVQEIAASFNVAGSAGADIDFNMDTALVGTVANSMSNVVATDLGDTTKVANLLESNFSVTGVTAAEDAASRIFAIEANDAIGKFGVYVWTQSTATDTSIDAGELKILGIFTGEDFNSVNIQIEL